MQPPWPDDPAGSGRPPGRVERLLYNRPSDTLVAMMVRSNPPVQRLDSRRLPETAYRPIGVRHELESQQDALCCERAPFLLFNEMRLREPRPPPAYLQVVLRDEELPPEGWSADWLDIRRFDLETGEDTRPMGRAPSASWG